MQRRKFLRGGMLGLGGLFASRGLTAQPHQQHPNREDFNAFLQERVAQSGLRGSVFDLQTEALPLSLIHI